MHGFGFGGFDEDGGVGEARVVDEALEGGGADFAVSEVFVAINF